MLRLTRPREQNRVNFAAQREGNLRRYFAPPHAYFKQLTACSALL
jgi:hypothetical protein